MGLVFSAWVRRACQIVARRRRPASDRLGDTILRHGLAPTPRLRPIPPVRPALHRRQAALVIVRRSTRRPPTGGGASARPRRCWKPANGIDLFDHHFGNFYERGLAMLPIPESIADLSRQARPLAAPIIRPGRRRVDHATLRRINDACRAPATGCTRRVHATFFGRAKVPGLLGGDHSTPTGRSGDARGHVEHLPGTAALSRREGLGILHLDTSISGSTSKVSLLARVDHAERARRHLPAVRVWCRWASAITAGGNRVRRVPSGPDQRCSSTLRPGIDPKWAGRSWPQLCAMIVIGELPPMVYVAVRHRCVGTRPALSARAPRCQTGWSFNQAVAMLVALSQIRPASSALISTGLPGPVGGGPGGDANVGRLFCIPCFKLCGAAAATEPA